ncbi:MAG TPA: hypothetical protein VF527_10415 [Pyrinomonadaceae bacterium]|jgi:hypothetical protein
MSSSAAKKTAITAGVPSVVGTWTKMQVSNDRNLAMLDSLEVTSQVEDVNRDLIFGSVKTIPPVTAYAIENGTVTAESVSFQMSIEGIVYTFTGTVGASSIGGSVTSPGLAGSHPGTEEGSWSAQAQPGPGEEEEKKHPRKHTKRPAR